MLGQLAGLREQMVPSPWVAFHLPVCRLPMVLPFPWWMRVEVLLPGFLLALVLPVPCSN